MLWAAESARTLKEGVEKADAALKSGKPRAVLEQLIRGERPGSVSYTHLTLPTTERV